MADTARELPSQTAAYGGYHIGAGGGSTKNSSHQAVAVHQGCGHRNNSGVSEQNQRYQPVHFPKVDHEAVRTGAQGKRNHQIWHSRRATAS